MPLVIQCPHCHRQAQVADGYGGRKVRCPGCHKAFTAQPPTPVNHQNRSSPPGNGKSAASSHCPICKAQLPFGATMCSECGWLRTDADAIEADPQPLFCTNPACGVANPITERYCQRCNALLPSPPGTLMFGRYRLERLLAMGGFGAVYYATDVKANRPVAIKDMICTDPQEFHLRLGFFRREAEILRALDRLPIVPRLYEFIEEGQAAHLIMEFIRGQDLLKVMETNNGKPFPLDLIVEWGQSICEVLQHMHTLNPPVVHRDLKPDNLMLLEDGRTIKLIDFGTVRDMGATRKNQPATATRVYTEGYAPPEQIIGKPEVRSDLFALAGTLYHLATGKAPEGFYTGRELESQLKQSNGALPAEQRWFYELIKVNLAEDVNDRYFSAQEIQADLQLRKITREVSCPSCRQPNPVRVPYCAKCAQPLTPPMPSCQHCGRNNRLGSRFCIHCGHRLR